MKNILYISKHQSPVVRHCSLSKETTRFCHKKVIHFKNLIKPSKRVILQSYVFRWTYFLAAILLRVKLAYLCKRLQDTLLGSQRQCISNSTGITKYKNKTKASIYKINISSLTYFTPELGVQILCPHFPLTLAENAVQNLFICFSQCLLL